MGCYLAHLSPTPLDTYLGLLPCPTDGNETCTILCHSSSSSVSSTSMVSCPCTDEFCTLYFDGSKTHDVSATRCVLIDIRQRKHFVSSLLDFE